MPKASIVRWGFVIALALVIVVRQYYTWYMPKAAEVGSGRIFGVLVNYDRTVYVTSLERVVLYASYVALAIATIGLAVAITRSRNGRRNGFSR
jgi:hypothetical protein